MQRAWVVGLLIAIGIGFAGVRSGGEAVAAEPRAGGTTPAAGRAAVIEHRGKKRPGCRRFCQQAGGFGGGNEGFQPVGIPAQTVDDTGDRIIAIRGTCNLESDCVGAIIVNNRRFEYGRADLEIPAGETRRVRVGISRKAKRWLSEHGKDEKAFATVPLTDHAAPVSVSGNLTVLAP